MTEQKHQAQSVFLNALEISAERERAAFLEAHCGADRALRQEVDELLDHARRLGQFLDPGEAGTDAMSDHSVTEQPGATIGPYKLLQQIGEGGMGVVYMANQTEPVRRQVALKIIKLGMDSKQVVARFEAEQQALSLMDHPNIAKVIDASTTDAGRPYFVMELVKGQPITEYCDQHQLTPRQRLELLLPVCQAVQHAHQKGVIHRDIKPSNILVAEYDEQPVPKVIDFGVAKAVNQPLTEKTVFTALGQIVGTLEYMSPEQAKVNQREVDTRTDVYALGVVLYELLTGTTPFDKQRLRAAAWDEMLRIIREEEPPKPSTRLSDSQKTVPSISADRHTESSKLTKLVRGELDWIVMKALEKDRARRYDTASALAADIGHYLHDEPVVACPPSAAYRFRKFARRNKAALAIGGLSLFFLMLLGSGIGWTLRDKQAREQAIARDRAVRQARVSEQVELILADVARLEQQQQWSEALVAARRAEAVLASGETPQDVHARVRQVISDLELVARLEEIRLIASESTERGFNYAGANQQYAAALCEYGIDVDALPADEAIRLLQSRAAVLPALIIALDDWASCRQQAVDEASAKPLAELARALDTDPWRRRERDILAHGSAQELQDLIDSEEVAHQPASTIELLAGELYFRGKSEDAIRILERALREHPDDFWLHKTAAWLHARLSGPPHLEEATRHYTAALALRPGSAIVHCSLGDNLQKQGRLEEAIACHLRAIELDPNYAPLHNDLGSALRVQGRLDEAIASYRRAIELNPKSASAYHNLGTVLMDQEQLDEAIASYRRAIELDPKFALAHTNLGVTLATQGNLDDAIACWRQAVACYDQVNEHTPEHAAVHCNLGLALSSQNKVDEAIASYRRAIQLDPKLAPAYNGLAWLLATAADIQLRNPGEAVQLARTAVQIDPTSWEMWDTLSVAAYRAGKWTTSLNARQEKLQRHPIDTDDRLFLAMTHWQLGDKAAARQSYDEAMTEIANDPAASDSTSRLRQEAEQLLGITASPTPPEGGEPTGEEPPP